MFACPVANCGGTSANFQGVVAHLRMVHKLEKPERDALTAALKPAAAAPRDYTANPDMRPCKTCGKPCNWTGGKTPYCDTNCESAAPVVAPKVTRKAAAKSSDTLARIERWLGTEAPHVE